MEDPWHSWYMPEKASGTEVAAATQWQGQQHLLCLSGSAVAAEMHLADLKPLLSPKVGDILVVLIDEAPEHTIISDGVVIVAVS